MSEDGENITTGPNGLRTGRPPKYNNCLDLQAMCEDYFDACDIGKLRQKLDAKSGQVREWVEQEPYTIIGLTCHLGLVDKGALWEYASRSDSFSTVVKSAVNRIERQRNSQLLTSEANTIGSIFLLKSCHGYRDTPEQQQSSGITVIIEGGSTIKLGTSSQSQQAIDCEYQTVTVALPSAASAHASIDDNTD